MELTPFVESFETCHFVESFHFVDVDVDVDDYDYDYDC